MAKGEIIAWIDRKLDWYLKEYPMPFKLGIEKAREIMDDQLALYRVKALIEKEEE